MHSYYTLNPTTRISAFIWNDFFPNKNLVHKTVEVTEIDMNSDTGYIPKRVKNIKYPGETAALTHELKVHVDINNRKYFIWKNTPVYLDNWDYHNISVLCEEIYYAKQIKDRWFVHPDMILASLMKQSDKFGVLIKPRWAHFLFPGTTLGVCGEADDTPILFIPSIEPLRTVEDWHYKIKFKPADDINICAKEDYYFTDFVSLLYSGYLELVEL